MPRLSIIVPHLQDDFGLESTLLSILENRREDFEILIAHSGEFRDPYQLDRDEAMVIESPRGSSLATQLNQAAMSATSGLIQVLLPGAIVSNDWADEAIELMHDGSIDAVCLPVKDEQSHIAYVGLDGRSIPHRRVTQDGKHCISPLLCGGIFRSSTLECIGGWFERSTRESAEVELALMLTALELRIVIARESTISASKRIALGQEASYELGYACGQLACAYGSIEDSGVVVDSVSKRLGHLASGLMSPKTVAERLGWVMGIRDRSLMRVVAERLANAEDSLAVESSLFPIRSNEIRSSNLAVRRAA